MKDPKKEKNNRKTGGNYEQAVGFYLEQHGYQILPVSYTHLDVYKRQT